MIVTPTLRLAQECSHEQGVYEVRYLSPLKDSENVQKQERKDWEGAKYDGISSTIVSSNLGRSERCSCLM